MDALALVVDVGPLQATALSPHPGGNDELEICFILDALIFKRSDDLLNRFFIGNKFLFFLTGVFVGPPGRIMIKKAARHRVGEDST